MGGTVDRNHIFVAVSVYLLLGFSWFAVYSFVDLLNTRLIPLHLERSRLSLLSAGDRVYHSFKALTTLGMGELVPFNSILWPES